MNETNETMTMTTSFQEPRLLCVADSMQTVMKFECSRNLSLGRSWEYLLDHESISCA